MSDVHPAAARGFGQGTDAYVRGRPDFPPAALDWLCNDLGLRAGTTAVELGAGTGKFTKLLVETTATVVAVEPVAAMLERLARDLPGVAAVHGQAQRIPLADASADAVVCAQAFHWFATAEALAEIHRVLKPRAPLGLIWSFIAALDGAARARVLDQVRALIGAKPALAGHESVARPYVTRAYWCRRA